MHSETQFLREAKPGGFQTGGVSQLFPGKVVQNRARTTLISGAPDQERINSPCAPPEARR